MEVRVGIGRYTLSFHHFWPAVLRGKADTGDLRKPSGREIQVLDAMAQVYYYG